MDEKERAAPVQHREAAQEVLLRPAIISPAQNLGNCISCGSRIALVGGATACPTCSAWRRWYSAARIASGYLREVSQ